MTITAQQRKFFLWCGGILAAWWIFGLISNWSHQAAFRHQQAIRAMQRAKPAPSRLAPPSPLPRVPIGPVSPDGFPPPAKLLGVWNGKGALEGRGICILRFELRNKDADNYAGFSSFMCAMNAPFMSDKDRNNVKAGLISKLDPDTAILTGKVQNGAIHFTVDKTIGTAVNGCAVTSFTLTPFGANFLNAEWQEGTCPGGHMLLVKAHQ